MGLLLGRVESPPLVILAYYALLFVVAVPVLGLSSRTLAILAVVAAVVTPLASHAAAAVAWTPRRSTSPAARDILVELFLTGTYPVLTWTTYLFAGLAVGRSHLRRVSVAAKLLVGGAALAVVAKLASAVLLCRWSAAESQLASSTEPAARPGRRPAGAPACTAPPRPATGAGWRSRRRTAARPSTWRTPSAPAWRCSALCLLLARVLPRWCLVPLAAVGQHDPDALHPARPRASPTDSPLLTNDPRALWLWHVGLALVLATVWRTQFGRGPLEALSAVVAKSAGGLAGARRSTGHT